MSAGSKKEKTFFVSKCKNVESNIKMIEINCEK